MAGQGRTRFPKRLERIEMNTFSKNLVICVIFFFSICLFCKDVTASDLEDTYANFFRKIESVKEWEELNVLRKDYLVDDGVFSELFSEKVEWLFQNRYKDFFSKIVYRDGEYFAFIKRHVDDTWAYGSARTFKNRLEEGCPKNHEAICLELIELIGRNKQ